MKLDQLYAGARVVAAGQTAGDAPNRVSLPFSMRTSGTNQKLIYYYQIDTRPHAPDALPVRAANRRACVCVQMQLR